MLLGGKCCFNDSEAGSILEKCRIKKYVETENLTVQFTIW
jgi:hypothetical protein